MEAVALNFFIDPVVTKALLATKIQNLEEFRFLFEDESKVDTSLAKIQLGEDRKISGPESDTFLDRWAYLILINGVPSTAFTVGFG